MCLEGMMTTMEKEARLTGLLAEIWTQNIPNMKEKSHLASCWSPRLFIETRLISSCRMVCSNTHIHIIWEVKKNWKWACCDILSSFWMFSELLWHLEWEVCSEVSDKFAGSWSFNFIQVDECCSDCVGELCCEDFGLSELRKGKSNSVASQYGTELSKWGKQPFSAWQAVRDMKLGRHYMYKFSLWELEGGQ